MLNKKKKCVHISIRSSFEEKHRAWRHWPEYRGPDVHTRWAL